MCGTLFDLFSVAWSTNQHFFPHVAGRRQQLGGGDEQQGARSACGGGDAWTRRVPPTNVPAADEALAPDEAGLPSKSGPSKQGRGCNRNFLIEGACAAPRTAWGRSLCCHTAGQVRHATRARGHTCFAGTAGLAKAAGRRLADGARQTSRPEAGVNARAVVVTERVLLDTAQRLHNT